MNPERSMMNTRMMLIINKFKKCISVSQNFSYPLYV
jgi:hypothetical protein